MKPATTYLLALPACVAAGVLGLTAVFTEADPRSLPVRASTAPPAQARVSPSFALTLQAPAAGSGSKAIRPTNAKATELRAGQREETKAASPQGGTAGALKHLRALGREAQDAKTLALMTRLVQDALSGRSDLPWNKLLAGLSDDVGQALLRAALDRPETDPLLRRFAAVHLAWMLPPAESLRVYERQLQTEKDPRVAAHLARSLATHRGDASITVLELSYHRNDDERTRLGLIDAIARVEGAAARETLQRLAQTERSPALKELASKRLARLTAPVEGFRITLVKSGSQAARFGWREGDIVVRVDSAPVKSSRDLARLASGSRREVAIEVYRAGTIRAYRVDPAALGIAGTYVTVGA